MVLKKINPWRSIFIIKMYRFLIDQNCIGDEGVIALAGSIAAHKSLTDFSIITF
jgi:hypothetical protein